MPYPLGIPLLMPGENAGAANGPFIGYLEHDVHGVDHVGGDYMITCVADDAVN